MTKPTRMSVSFTGSNNDSVTMTNSSSNWAAQNIVGESTAFDENVNVRLTQYKPDRNRSIVNLNLEIEPDIVEVPDNQHQGTMRGVSVTPSGDAVVIRNAKKSYRCGPIVLNDLNMTVPCGSIYGLIGSSGCGKTTLLSCIVGIKKLDQGKIWIFGHPPGTKSIGVPGRNVGYMPQDLSLYREFSIRETLNYFGTLCGMTNGEIEKGRTYLVKMLSLPKESTRVGSLSGGQQRRVSLVVALFSQPELLILDEPTVGLDPVIRQNIWLHLKQLVKNQRTTVIVTTHYIEECRNADNIGIMRNGRLLEERQTNMLMLEHGSNNLEKIVLDLTKKDITPPPYHDGLSYREIIGTYKETPSNMAKVIHEPSPGPMNSLTRIRALTGKNFVVLFRNPLFLFFVILCAAVVGGLANIALGQDSKDLRVGLVNHDIRGGHPNCDNFTRIPGECNTERLSCHFLSKLRKDIFQFETYDTESEAEAAVRSGANWGYISFPSNFSSAFYERLVAVIEPDEVLFNSTEFRVKLDETSKLVAATIKVDLIYSYEDFIKDILEDCGYGRRQGEYIIKFRTPIFGNDETNFREFLAPGAGLTLLFFFPIITTSIRYIKEKKSGVLHRSIVGGVKTWEVMVAYSISEFFVIVLQSIANYILMTQIFEIKIKGADILVVLLFLLSGYGGVSMGFLLGSVCTEEITAAILAMAAFLPNMLLSGVLWPREGMIESLQQVTQVLPCALAGEAVRSITSRGLEFSHPNVWPGFAVLIAYIIGYFILTLLFHMKCKR